MNEKWKDVHELNVWLSGVKKRSRNLYLFAIRRYEEFTGLTPTKAIDEAEADLKKLRRARGLPLQRIKDFYEWLTTKYVRKDGEVGMGEYGAMIVVKAIKSFYSVNGFPYKWRPPKVAPKKKNNRIELTPGDVQKEVDVAPTKRDASLILTGFQGGLDADTVVKLNIADLPNDFISIVKNCSGDVDAAVVKITPPILLSTIREKEGTGFHTCLGYSATRALVVYLWERICSGHELLPDAWIYVQEGCGKLKNIAMEPRLVCDMMKTVALKSGIVSEEMMRYADINPAGYHALRVSFQKRLEYVGMPLNYIEYMMGHELEYKGTYSKPNPRRLLDKYKEFGHVLELRGVVSAEEKESILKKEIDALQLTIRTLQEKHLSMEKEQLSTKKEMKMLEARLTHEIDARLSELDITKVKLPPVRKLKW